MKDMRHAYSTVSAPPAPVKNLGSQLRVIERPDHALAPRRSGYFTVKRAIDVAISGILLTTLSPILAIVAILVKAESRGPALFRQRRLGRSGRPFTIYKFRTMRSGADAEQNDLRARNEAGGPNFKIRNDPRITTVGKFLRKFSIDELPQLFNVLKGDMSLVGPRPFPLADFAADRLTQEDARYWSDERHVVRPGLTGLWQVSGRNDLPFDRLIALDLIYVQNVGFFLDAEILAKTLPVVLLNKGAY